MYWDICGRECSKNKSDSAIRGSVKFGLQSILNNELKYLSSTIMDKKAQVSAGGSFAEIAQLVDEIRELEKSKQKVLSIIAMIEEV